MERIKKIIRKEYIEIIAFIIILFVAIFVRLYKIGDIPKGLHVDEVGMAYDAFCLANFRVDRYLNHLPVYLINFGGGQSAMYAYVAAIFVKLFGLGIFQIRMPAFIFNIIAIAVSYFMVKKHIGKKSAFVVMALFTINPWNIMASRWGLDCNLLAPLSVISLFFLFRSKNCIDYFFSGICFGITLYTYALSYIIIPLFLFFSFIYMLYTKKIGFKEVIFFSIPLFIFAMPLLLMILVNNGYINEIKGFITIPMLPEYRGSEISLLKIKENLFLIKNIFTHDELVYNAFPEFGTLYYLGIPLAIVGIFVEIYFFVKNIKEKKFEINSVILLFFISVFICILIIDSPNINRANAIYFPLIFFTYRIVRLIYKKSKIIFIIITLIYCVFFIKFEWFYFNEYNKKYSNQVYFENDLMVAINIVNSREIINNKDIDIYTLSANPYIYVLYLTQMSPYEYNRQKDIENNFGKYIFNKTYINENIVYIIKDNGDLVYELAYLNGFSAEQYGNYVILYKNN